MNKAQRILLAVSIACGLLATAAVFLALQNKMPVAIGSRKVLVAARDMAAGHAIDIGSDVKAMDVPDTDGSKALLSRSYKPEEMPALTGKRVAQAVAAGRPLMYADLAETQELQLGPEMRGLAVSVSGAAGLGGLLVPGDRVDVWVTTEERPALPMGLKDTDDPRSIVEALSNMSAGVRHSSDPVAKDIKVLAVGRRLGGTRTQLRYFSGDHEVSGDGGIVTLEVTEADARAILSRSGAGASAVTLLLKQPAKN